VPGAKPVKTPMCRDEDKTTEGPEIIRHGLTQINYYRRERQD